MLTGSTPSLQRVWRPLRAMATTIVPEAQSLEEGGWHEMRRLMEGALRARPAGTARSLRLLVRLLYWLPLARHGRTFAGLDPDGRMRFLEAVQDSRLTLVRRGFWGLRTLVLMGYYGRAQAAAEIGYQPRMGGWRERS